MKLISRKAGPVLASAVLAGTVLAGAVGGVAMAGAGRPASAEPVASPTPLLAYYYLWFNHDSWNRAKIDYPLIGRYASNEASVMRSQVAEEMCIRDRRWSPAERRPLRMPRCRSRWLAACRPGGRTPDCWRTCRRTS